VFTLQLLGPKEAGVVMTSPQSQRPTSVQNLPFFRVFSATQPRKGNRVIETYGAGDGNRTHVRSLGKRGFRDWAVLALRHGQGMSLRTTFRAVGRA